MINDEQLSTHFKRSEFACKCGCGLADVDLELVEVLEALRVYFDKPVIINSGCRCVDYNNSLQDSSKTSQHVKGKAADVRIVGVPASKVQQYFYDMYPDQYGIGRYKTFTHIDVRKQHARW